MRALGTVLMMIGSMVLSFAAVVFIIALAGSQFGSGLPLGRRYALGLAAVVIGVVLVGVGVLMSRLRRPTTDAPRSEHGTV